MARRKKLDWKKVLMKFLWSAAFTLVSALIAYWQNDARYYALIPLLEAARNWLKHK